MGFRKRGSGEGPELPEDEFGGGLKTVILEIDGHSVRALRMSQMPIMRILPIMAETDGMAQLRLLMDLLKDSLLDPLDWEKHVLPAKMESIGAIIAAWTETMDTEYGDANGGKKKKR